MLEWENGGGCMRHNLAHVNAREAQHLRDYGQRENLESLKPASHNFDCQRYRQVGLRWSNEWVAAPQLVE